MVVLLASNQAQSRFDPDASLKVRVAGWSPVIRVEVEIILNTTQAVSHQTDRKYNCRM
jgi:hypothetical protein